MTCHPGRSHNNANGRREKNRPRTTCRCRCRWRLWRWRCPRPRAGKQTYYQISCAFCANESRSRVAASVSDIYHRASAAHLGTQTSVRRRPSTAAAAAGISPPEKSMPGGSGGADPGVRGINFPAAIKFIGHYGRIDAISPCLCQKQSMSHPPAGAVARGARLPGARGLSRLPGPATAEFLADL